MGEKVRRGRAEKGCIHLPPLGEAFSNKKTWPLHAGDFLVAVQPSFFSVDVTESQCLPALPRKASHAEANGKSAMQLWSLAYEVHSTPSRPNTGAVRLTIQEPGNSVDHSSRTRLHRALAQKNNGRDGTLGFWRPVRNFILYLFFDLQKFSNRAVWK